MENSVIFENEYIRIISHSGDLFIETFKKGFSFEQLNSILAEHPQIEISSFISLRNAINNAPKPLEKIGKLKERISIETVNQDIKAFVTFNLTKKELDMDNRANLIKETSVRLKESGTVFGIKSDLFSGEILPGKAYVIAEGIPPVNGTDSIVKLYELNESKPEIHQDGKANFYDLKLINRVKAGDWLGERIDATQGIPGTSVKGTEISAVSGKTLPLLFDRNSVAEEQGDGKTVLYSRINGAVSYSDGKISISNHLEIDGNVDFHTGNLDFDGYLTIKGTVADGFSVTATKDIEINGVLGLGHVKGIISKEGSVYIKGGISSKGKVEIKAAKNIYAKFVDNTLITCGETLNIGFYCINSNVIAKEVIIESGNGQIIGGTVKALVRVVSPIIGSPAEKRTVVEVDGFDREAFKQDLEDILRKISELKNEQQKLRQSLSHFEDSAQLNPFQRKEYNDCIERIVNIKDEIKELDEGRKSISGYLKARGEGEINSSKKIYPNTSLSIKKHTFEITSLTPAAIYFVQDGELKQA